MPLSFAPSSFFLLLGHFPVIPPLSSFFFHYISVGMIKSTRYELSFLFLLFFFFFFLSASMRQFDGLLRRSLKKGLFSFSSPPSFLLHSRSSDTFSGENVRTPVGSPFPLPFPSFLFFSFERQMEAVSARPESIVPLSSLFPFFFPPFFLGPRNAS